jgi:hypothetical protein
LKVKPESNNGSYLYPEESSPHGHTSLLWDHIIIISSTSVIISFSGKFLPHAVNQWPPIILSTFGLNTEKYALDKILNEVDISNSSW